MEERDRKETARSSDMAVLQQRVAALEEEIRQGSHERGPDGLPYDVYRRVFGDIDAAMFIFDQDGTILVSNRAFERLSGFSQMEIDGKKRWTAFVTPEDLDKILTSHEDQNGGIPGMPQRYEFRFLGQGGPSGYVLLTMKNIEATTWRMAVLQDITDAIKMKEALRERDEMFHALTDNSPDAVMHFDASFRHLYVNPVVEKLTGIPAKAFIGKTHAELGFPQPLVDLWKDAISKVFRERHPHRVELQLPSGAWLEGLLVPEFSSAGNVRAAITSARDITDKKRHESQWVESQKLEALGTLSDGIAHEFNNILMGVQGYVSLLHFQKGDKQAHEEKLKNIEQLIEKGANLTRQLLGFAQNGMYEVCSTDMNQLINECAEMFGRTKREIQIHRTLKEDLWQVAADRGQLNQVFLNIFINAWQAMPAGGDLFLESRNVTLGDEDTGPFNIKAGPYVEIIVRDTGVGMDESTRLRIFEPFFTTKDTENGTGLGLAFVYGVIKNHGGMVRIFSEKGQGSTFKIYFPAEPQNAEKQEDFKVDMAGGMETILIVDDEEINISVLQEWLEILGYKVMAAQNGQDAIELYRRHSREIQLVILDMVMPGMNGGEVFDVMKTIHPDVRAILSSGYSIDGKAKEIMQRGIKAFIQKPFRIDSMAQKIREVLSS